MATLRGIYSAKRADNPGLLSCTPYLAFRASIARKENFYHPRSCLGIPSDPDDRRKYTKTAITTPFGMYEFSYMSFGLRNVAQTF